MSEELYIFLKKIQHNNAHRNIHLTYMYKKTFNRYTSFHVTAILRYLRLFTIKKQTYHGGRYIQQYI